MGIKNTFVEGQDVYSDFYGRGKVLRTDGRINEGMPESHAAKWPVVVMFNNDESFLVTFNKYGWYNFTSTDPAKDIRPLTEREIVLPDNESPAAKYFPNGEKLLTASEAFWMLACTAAGFVMGALAVMGIHHG